MKANMRIRFEALTTPEPMSGCTLWIGSTRGGYGKLRVKGRYIPAHWAAWLLAGRDVPENMKLLHKCDNKVCVNVTHLFLGTLSVNSHDMARKERGRKSKRGLPYGVALLPHGRFQAQVTFDNKTKYLGSYDTVIEAADVAAEFKSRKLLESKS